jgi:hypothetical protein
MQHRWPQICSIAGRRYAASLAADMQHRWPRICRVLMSSASLAADMQGADVQRRY